MAVLTIARRIVPERVKAGLLDLARSQEYPDINRRPYAPDARHGEIAALFEFVREIPGFFTFDDCTTFLSMLRLQSAYGITGDLFEIGPYMGRSTSVLVRGLAPGERLVVCDAFEAGADVDYPEVPSPEVLWRNVQQVNPGLDREVMEIIRSYSTDLTLPDAQRFRFVHVDGGHSAEVARHDLELAWQHLVPGGIISVDDYEHPMYPGVTEAVEEFLAARPQVRVLLDANRHAESGRKLYLQSPVDDRAAPTRG